MTISDKIKWIADYFGIEMSEYDKKKLESILKGDERVIVKEVPVVTYRSFDEKKEPIDLMEELKQSCEKFGVPLSQVIMGYGKGGVNNVISARVYFARSVKIKDKDITSVQLGDILKKDHTTILYYWYNSKADCEIPPFRRNRN